MSEFQPTVVPKAAWSIEMDKQLDRPGKLRMTTHMQDGGYYQGLPIGGFGSGSMGRNYRGGFGRWTIKAGSLKHFQEPANVFAVHQRTPGQPPMAAVLHSGYPVDLPNSAVPEVKRLAAWPWSDSLSNGTYSALFPKAWYHYAAVPGMPVEVTCEQFSPVLPGNYKESSYPIGLFKYHLRNTSDVPVDCSILFSFTNMVGWFDDFSSGRPHHKSGGNCNSVFHAELPSGEPVTGILFHSTHARDVPAEGNGEMCIACKGGDGIDLSWHRMFNIAGDGGELWDSFGSSGRLSNSEESWVSDAWTDVGGAIAATATVGPAQTREITMTLVWDLPVIQFGGGSTYFRKYTRYFGTDGQNAVSIAKTGLSECDKWSKEIDRWHRDPPSGGDQPAWFHGMRLNELYMLIDGLTVWTDKAVGHGAAEDFFGLIECPDYDFYNTLDLWVYGSFPFLRFWPEIEKAVTGLYADTLLDHDPRRRKLWAKEGYCPINARGSAPHDHGHPKEDPVGLVNGYAWQDVSRWKDLNSQFVLLVYRDYVHTGDAQFLERCYPAAREAVEYLLQFDKDGDGLIENEGFPDQTFDNLPMNGPSAYCGGLWLGALAAIVRMAETMGDGSTIGKYSEILEKARVAFDALLWNGSYYRFDVRSEGCENVFIEQLFGIWYAGLCGIDDLVPREHICKALNAIYEHNFLGVDEGRNGAICIREGATGVKHPNVLADNSTQVTEVLSGINMSLACQLAYYGETHKAMAILKALHSVIYVEKGLWFRTPAAWDGDGNFRAIMNMRPLVIWAFGLVDA